MRRKNPVKREKKVCSVCGGSSGIYYKAIPPYKCGDCFYKEKCPDEKLRAFAESLERANNGWGHMSAKEFYTSIDSFINGVI